MIFPKKPQVLYAPMLGTIGGGSLRSFGRGTGGSNLDPVLDGNFPVGYYNTGMVNANSGWFSSGSYGYTGVDQGSDYQFTAGQDVSRQVIRYKTLASSNHSFYIIIFKLENNSTKTFSVHYAFRIDDSTGTNATVVTKDINTCPSVGNSVIPATGDYYLGWRSGVPSGVGNGSAGSMYVETTGQYNSSSVIHYSGSGAPNSTYGFGDQVTMDTQNQAKYLAIRIENK
tara:strand:- start:177 stop:857 length:681 start_codon:yes stop_codon:yes gene_type:complete